MQTDKLQLLLNGTVTIYFTLCPKTLKCGESDRTTSIQTSTAGVYSSNIHTH